MDPLNWIMLAGFLLMVGGLFGAAWPSLRENFSIQKQADWAEERWRRDCERQGMSLEQMHLDSQLRQTQAMIQEEASQAVYTHSGDITEKIRDIGMDHIDYLNRTDPEAGQALTNILRQTPPEALLTDDALAHLDSLNKRREPPAGWKKPVRQKTPQQIKADNDDAWNRLNAFTIRKG